VDIFGKNDRLVGDQWVQYGIVYCSRESRTGGRGSGSGTGRERVKGATEDGARSGGMWDSRTHEPKDGRKGL
jgi:hypothetical protein